MTWSRRSVLLAPVVLLAGLVSPSSGQVKLKFGFPENQEYTYDTKVLVDQVLSINGTDVPTKSNQAIVTRMAIGTARPDGNVPVRKIVDSLKVNIEVGGMALSFDSDDKGEAPEGELPQLKAIRESVKASAGANYVVVIDKDGKVVGIEGAENGIPNGDKVDAAVLEQMKKRLAPERLKQENVEEFGLFPSMTLRPGDTWDRTEVMDMDANQKLTFQRRYEYAGTVEAGGKTYDKITSKSSSVSYSMEAGPGSPVTVPESKLEIASSEGTVLFDRATGQIVKQINLDRITGDMTLVAGGQELPSKLDLTMTVESTLRSAGK